MIGDYSDFRYKQKRRNELQNEIDRLLNQKREISKIPVKDRNVDEERFFKFVDDSIETLSRELMEL